LRKAAAIGIVAHDALNLGGDNDGFTAGMILQEPPQHFLAGSAGVNIGSVEEIDPEIERLTKIVDGLTLPGFRRTLDTVAVVTPAICATSLRVAIVLFLSVRH